MIDEAPVQRWLAVDELREPGGLPAAARCGARMPTCRAGSRGSCEPHHPAHVQDGDAVEHDRGDHLVRAGARLEHARDRAVETAAEHAGERARRGPRAPPGASPTKCHVPTHAATVAPMSSWPSTPMLNRPAAERERDRERGADERRRPPERSREAVGAAEHAPEQRPVRGDRVLADEQDDHAADREREQDRADRHEDRLDRRSTA